MRSTLWNRFVRTGVSLALLAAVVGTTLASAAPAPGRPRRPRAMNLFATAQLLLEANRVVCNISNAGEVCSAAGSPVGGGGFWPRGTFDQYIFNSGLQIAAVVEGGIPGFAWSGDTVGTFIFDPRGDQASGDPLTSIYNSLDPGDRAAWPNGAVVRDAAIFNSVLLGRDQISEGDSWVRYWEGNPALLGGRTHPMGLVVEQRSLAWNFPSGNEDILYFVFTFYNVTASDPAAYNNPTIDPAIRAEIAAAGALFQQQNEAKFGLDIPAGGYALEDMYAAFAMDADVAVFSHNYATAFLPFNIGSTYTGDFLPEVGWTFPDDVFGSPFFPAPGFIGVKYLKSPESSPGVEVGLTMFSNTTNGLPFPDAQGVNLLYRRLSGFLGPADVQCTFTDPAVARIRRLCALVQVQTDARFYQASGPFDLPPGEARTIVVAYVQAAPVGLVAPYVGSDVKPGIPYTGDSIRVDPTKVRLIDSIAGWVSASDVDLDLSIEQTEVTTVPRSLLQKALVAQAVFDAKFLLPFSPEAPPFFLVPGSNKVTVVWQESRSETDGDPFFAIASQPFDSVGGVNALYDPNFRQYDVEGYRIYRGRSASELELIQQFDYAGTTFRDFTGALQYGDEDGDGLQECAPELGLQDDCPVTFETAPPNVTFFPAEIVGTFVQVKSGDRVELASGSVLNLSADTAVVGGGSGFPGLSNNGVPFAYEDLGVRNSFTYVYAVTAFDVNSRKSGPSSLESPRITQAVTPRSASGQEGGGGLSPLELLGADGTVLTGTLPTIDPATGIFSGPMPPTDGASAGLVAFVPELLGTGSVTVTIDSVIPGYPEIDVMPGQLRLTIYHMTGQGAGAPVQFTVPLELHQYDEDRSGSTIFPATAVDQTKAARFGGDSTFSLNGQAQLATAGTWELASWGRGSINGAPANSDFNGPRWWAGAANENTANPNGGNCPGSPGACGNTVPVPNLTRTAGAIAGVDIFHVQSYNSVPNAPMRNLEPLLATVTRAADFRVYWGAAGAVDSVVDVTHRVRVPFSPVIRASWGILTVASFAATTAALTGDANNALLTWSDIFCVAPNPTTATTAGNGNCGGAAQTPAVLRTSAALDPIAFSSSSYANTATLTANGTGFIFYLAGHFFLMRTAALPAAGTVWNARTYAGTVVGSAAGANYTYVPAVRSGAVPGLRLRASYAGTTFDPSVTTEAQLARIHTLPDPYYVTNSLEQTLNSKLLKFVNMPSRAIVRIYSVSGVLVQVLTIDDNAGGGELTWNLRNRNNQFVASGVYFYHVETPDGKTKVGRFTIVNFAP